MSNSHFIQANIALLLVTILPASCTFAKEATDGAPRAIRQIPNLRSLPDSSAALQKQIDATGGTLRLDKSGVYRLTKTLVFDLAKHGAVKVQGRAGVTLVMDGPGPELRFVGSHDGTAGPKSFKPETWNQRMPVVSGIEIIGNHEHAVGIELFKTVESVISRVAVRWCHHGIHLVTRNRNVTISDCHLYENSGVGIYLDTVNLHQINVSNSHISYNRQGGIVVRDGNVRNLQVTGCDIEGNMPADETATRAANILLDVSGTAGDRSHSIAEVAITGCTIQHSSNYSGKKGIRAAPGGANIRLRGKKIYPINSVTISGNVISDTEVNLNIEHAHDVAVTGNTFFAPGVDHLHVSHSQRVVLTGNTFNPRQFVRPGALRFRDSSDCVIGTSTIHASTSTTGAVRLENCRGFVISSLGLTSGGSGIVLENSKDTTITTCRVSGTPDGGADLWVDSSNRAITLVGNTFLGSTTVDAAAVMKEPK